MSPVCRQACGSLSSLGGWVCLIVAAATNDWVRTCDYSVATCVRMDELGSRGLWTECVIAPALYHCTALNQILNLPAHVQASRAMMVCACLLGLPAMLLVLTSTSCVRLPHDSAASKKRRARVGGSLILLMAVLGLASTVWFPVGVHQEKGLMSFGSSLYCGWAGVALCFLGGGVVLCCHGDVDPRAFARESSFFYSRQRRGGREGGGGASASMVDVPANHAKSAHV
ncbi:claudin-11-like [Syngnathus acus]|uniref:claudin-11-like n=1 Tax=Syngnathus acus TaxID=161584 RepID=UPI001885B924|nr:claudin-11-like [Syngnathus acus]